MDPQDMVATVKKKTHSSTSWIQFDATGQGWIHDVDKYVIMNRVHIDARDLRILDPFPSYPSTILGRDKAFVLNLEHIKAIITANEVWLRDPANENVVPVVEELRRRLPKMSSIPQQQEDGNELLGDQQDIEAIEDDELPFEFRALNVALEAICSFLDARAFDLELDAHLALDQLTSKISSRSLDKVRKMKSRMTRLIARVQKVRDELAQLLEDDDDMADLYLSRKASIATSHFDENDVEELEQLLEAYFKQSDDTLNKLTALREYIDDTEDYINIQLDNHRNNLIQLELFLTSGTIGLSIFSLVAGIFGMNLPFTWNDGHEYMFKWVVIVGGVISLFLFFMIIIYAYKRRLIGSICWKTKVE